MNTNKSISIVKTLTMSAGTIDKMQIETIIENGIGIHIVGHLVDSSVREILLRTITAMQAEGFSLPGKKIVVNITPSDLHIKQANELDLPLAISILAANGVIEQEKIKNIAFFGELSLNGEIRKSPNACKFIETCETPVFFPFENKDEVFALESTQNRTDLYPVKKLSDLVRLLK